jgi:RNA recognition motif-containing protein
MKKIYVGNLNFSVTEAALRSLFEAYGSVASVNIVTDRDSGQPRGFGFVEMTNDAAAAKAINGLNGRDLEGRRLNVNEARPKPERAGGGYERKRW